MSTTLACFPEELLERILAECVVAPPSPHPHAPWHPSPATSLSPRTRTAPLLVSRAFYRIAVPLFYHTLVVHTHAQAATLLPTLTANPAFAASVRRLVLLAPAPEVLALCTGLRLLDITLPPADADGAFARALAAQPLPRLRHLALRKAPGTYLSQPAPRALLTALAAALPGAPLLESTTTSFPLSADPALAPLAAALTAAPALHTLRTPLPALWAPALCQIADNPTLQRICLGGEPSDREGGARGCGVKGYSAGTGSPEQPYILGTGLFFAEARKHARLSEVVRAGTGILRGRAQTMGASGASAPSASVSSRPHMTGAACSTIAEAAC
ncbi:hypothetical protein B0H10DRAFT_1947761 [Mycena sp. CBHHK59/15]|nr:hypothetical protein B0H10DRAFT_1947761 [Mycena sp. CBHHK59/15]